MRSKLLLLVSLMMVLFASCSRKKDKFLNKNFHAMTAYYNIIYNGNLALEEAKKEVEASFKEDYWNILPIERMLITEPETPKSTEEVSESTPFQIAEDKATKAIQKHSMFMGGKEYNPQIDEAFMLMGKARYYDQRFIPSKDAFNFILNHYPESSAINEAKIWLEKTNLRLDYFDTAIQKLTKLIKTTALSPDELHEATSTLAQAYISVEENQLAIAPLTTAITSAPNSQRRGRLLFIKGQLFALLGQKDSAAASFNEVIALKRKSPRQYMIHSELEKLRLQGLQNMAWDKAKLAFQELEDNRENRPFLDFIFYDHAMFNLAKDSIDLAITKFNASLMENPEDKYLKSRNYLNLGEVYFDRASYEASGKYYDSTLSNLDQKSFEYRLISRKRNNLEDVIKYERIAKETDSILDLVNASDEERIKTFKAYIDKLKVKDKSVFASETAPKLQANRFAAQKSQIGRPSSTTTFYFYDLTQKQRGEVSFQSTWGDLELTDDWRKNPIRSSTDIANQDSAIKEVASYPKYDPQTYIARIPSEQKVIDSISDQRNFASYQLGILYKEKFRTYKRAITKLEFLLKNSPEERLILPSKYNLYKIYQEIGEENTANKWKTDILTNHPESRYASILKNPEAYKNSSENPQNTYKRLYRKYARGDYDFVLNEIETLTKVFIGNAILPKLELLKARVLAKTEGVEAYKEALNYVALTYPQTKEGKYAQEQYTSLKDKPFIAEFDMSPDSEYMLVFNFTKDGTTTIKREQLKAKLSSILEDEKGLNLSLSQEAYNTKQVLVTVSGLKSQLSAEGFVEKLVKNDVINKSFNFFVISQKNYKIVQMHKFLNQYLAKIN